MRPIYKSYPVYAPGQEPPGYLDRLKQEKPVILWDDRGTRPLLQSEADWIGAGEMVFDAAIFYDAVVSVADVRNPEWHRKVAPPPTLQGILSRFGDFIPSGKDNRTLPDPTGPDVPGENRRPSSRFLKRFKHANTSYSGHSHQAILPGHCADNLDQRRPFMRNSFPYPESSHAGQVAALILAMMVASIASTEGTTSTVVMQTLHEFHRGSPGGYSPSGLVAGNDGDFYGTTAFGGTNDKGTAFKMTSDGAFITLASFDFPTNGKHPHGLIQGSDGNFYGPTGGFLEAETVIKMTPDGALTRLALMDSEHGWLLNGLIQGSDSNLYGTASNGGKYDRGSIIKVTLDGGLTTLVSFNGTNGQKPQLLIQGSDGNFYGSATLNDQYPDVMMFKLTPNGAITSLAVFTNRVDGYPTSLVQGRDGNLYGTTINEYETPIKGRIFRMSPDGNLSTLGVVDGVEDEFPIGLIEGSDGNFYGTANLGEEFPSENERGKIFKITQDGTLTTLASFAGRVGPRLVEGKNGRLYGTLTTSWGGDGTIFRLVEPPVLSTTRQPNGKVALSWNSFPGDTYRVEYKPTLTETNWAVLNPAVTAAGNTASLADDSGSASERYYRVRLLP